MALFGNDRLPIRAGTQPQREVHQADALVWLRENAALAGSSFITSLPDVSEVPGLRLPEWKAWFEDAALAVMTALPPEGVAIFFQSDIRVAGTWIDKGHLIARAADRAGLHTWFHHIVCRRPPGTAHSGRASYAHLQGFAARPPATLFPTADVLPEGGERVGTKAMGSLAALAACRVVEKQTTSSTIVDPFCGYGTVLAVANALGFHAVGVDLSPRMVRKSRALQFDRATGKFRGGAPVAVAP